MKARNVLKTGLVAVALAGSAFTSTSAAQAGVNRPANFWYNSGNYPTHAECNAWGQYHAGPNGIHDWLSYSCKEVLVNKQVCNLGACATLPVDVWELDAYVD